MIPAPFWSVAEKFVRKHPDDLEAAVAAVQASARKLPEWEQFGDMLRDEALRGAVHDVRHKINVATKKTLGDYGGPAKASRLGPTTNRIAQVYLDSLFFGGMCLGNMTGNDIDRVVANENAVIAGHQQNLRILQWCRKQGVVGDKRVRDVISERKLRAAMPRILATDTEFAAAGD